MALTLMTALLMAPAPAVAADVAFEELSEGRNEAAILRIENNEALAEDNPARLINLGIAHAREGDEAEARALFRSVVRSDTTVMLETATGEWVEARTLAKRALRMLDLGEFADARRVAAR